jgi:hypothetical protein
MIDPGDRADMIASTLERYRVGEYGMQRATALLVLCGLNASEIAGRINPIRSEAFENFRNYKRGPFK